MDSNGRVTSSLMRSHISSYFGVRWLGASGLVLALMTACSVRTARVAGPTAEVTGPRYYIDLEPGWRLRVVTPILKDGGYVVKTQGETVEPGFLGYEVSFYDVRARGVAFRSAEMHRKDEVTPASRPIVPLFQLPAGSRYVRLIYLLRASGADHEMAVVAARRREALDPFTAAVRADPEACRAGRSAWCAWIPNGIAVAPERPAGDQWEAAL